MPASSEGMRSRRHSVSASAWTSERSGSVAGVPLGLDADDVGGVGGGVLGWQEDGAAS